MRRVPQQQMNPGVRRERDRRALRRQIVLLVCGLAMAGGFVVAVGQHYAAVRYGYRSEELRAERVRLLAERERLLLELSEAESPGALERAARRIGMQPARPSQIAPTRRAASETPADEADRRETRAAGEQRKPAAVRDGSADAATKGRKGAADERARVVRADARPRIVDEPSRRGR